ncbi:hypothetical protein D6783_05085 [Candidatus Woesearchaeota archaeon]|nr:MAG: hypothetical protein D6783_05085 [Candidatus Woesearchaeota archaeon]
MPSPPQSLNIRKSKRKEGSTNKMQKTQHHQAICTQMQKKPSASKTLRTTLPLPLALLLALTLITPLVSSTIVVNYHSTGFQLTSPNDQIKMCQCAVKTDYVTLANEGSFPASYSLTLQSTIPPEHIKLGSTEVFLQPGQDATIPVYLTAACPAPEGRPTQPSVFQEAYTITATSSFGRQQTLDKHVLVGTCQNIQLAVEQTKPVVNLCEAQEYIIRIKNVATFKDEFSIDAGPYDQYLTILGPRNVVLNPGQEVSLHATLTLPCDAQEGTYAIPFTARSIKNGLAGTVTKDLIVQNRFDHFIKVNTQEAYCGREESALPITIGNMNTRENTYHITLDGPDFVTLGQDTLTIGAGHSASAIATLTPGREDYGTHELTITATSEIGHVTKQRVVELLIKPCYEHEITFLGEKTEARTTPFAQEKYTIPPQAPTENNQGRSKENKRAENKQPSKNNNGNGTSAAFAATCGEHTYTINVRNNGLTEQTFKLSRTGPSWVKLKEDEVTLAPSENANVDLKAFVPCTGETYPFAITATNEEAPEAKETITLTITALSKEDAYGITILNDQQSITPETKYLPLLLKHTGIQGGTYTLTLKNEFFTLTNTTLTIGPGEEKTVLLQTAKDLTTYFPGRYLGDLSLFITAPDGNVYFTRSFAVTLQSNNVFARAWRAAKETINSAQLSWCNIWTILLLILIAANILALASKKTPFSKTRQETRRIVAVLFGVGAVIFLLLAILTIQPATTENQATTAQQDTIIHQWPANTPSTLNLKTYFPDADRLHIVAAQPPNVAVTIKEGVATFVPDRNFVGENRIVFIAYDEEGTIRKSPFITLHVQPRTKLTFLTWLSWYCATINLILLALLCVLLAILFITPPKKRRSRKGGRAASQTVFEHERQDDFIPIEEIISPERPSSSKKQTAKRKRGRPKKKAAKKTPPAPATKRGRGRRRKTGK